MPAVCNQVRLESLERRVLLDGEPWGSIPALIRQDFARELFPSTTGAGQTVAILDTGIDYFHPALGDGFGPGHKVIGGFDFFESDNDPLDTHGHGTAVAGIIAADAFVMDGYKYQGVAPDAQLVAVRISDLPTNPVPDEVMRNALQWVLDHRAEFAITTVNISFGFGHFATEQNDGAFKEQLAALRDAGVLVVAASGNAGISDEPGVNYPAADPNCLAVGSVSEFDVISSFTERSQLLDLLAPGELVPTTTVGLDFARFDGTSFASPMVAATGALLRQVDPTIAIPDVLSILRSSGASNFDGDEEFGAVTKLNYPRLDVSAAIGLATARLAAPEPNQLDPGVDGNYNDLKFDAQGVLHFAWYDATARTLKYASRNTAGLWSNVQVVDAASDDLGRYLSLALTSAGKPGIAYTDATHGDLKYAQQAGDHWDAVTVDSKQSVGLYPSIVFSLRDQPRIAYYRRTSGDLRLASFDGAQWKIDDLNVGDDVGRSASIAIKPNGLLGVAYENTTNGRLKYTYQVTDTQWNTQTIDRARGVAFVSLAFGVGQRPCVSYYDAGPANLKYAAYKNNKWLVNVVESKGAVGLYSKLIQPTLSGEVRIVYYNRQLNFPMIATGHLGEWSTQALSPSGGRYVNAAVDPTTDLLEYTWFDPTQSRLQLDVVDALT